MKTIEIFDEVCDWVLSITGIYHTPKPENADEFPKREDRPPYPQDGPVEILPPVNDAETIAKREAVDKEFWSTL